MPLRRFLLETFAFAFLALVILALGACAPP